MEISIELIHDLIGETEMRPSVAGLLVQRLKQLQAVQKEIRELDRFEKGIKDEHATKLANLQSERAQIQSKCPHPCPEYHSGPEGAADSYHECKYCGKTW